MAVVEIVSYFSSRYGHAIHGVALRWFISDLLQSCSS